MFSLDSPHQSDSDENTQYTIFNIKKIITLNYPKSAAMGCCSKGLKKEFETAVVNEPSVFEPLKFYCNNNNKRLNTMGNRKQVESKKASKYIDTS